MAPWATRIRSILGGPDIDLPDHALVVRGGTLATQDVLNNAEATHIQTGVWGISARSDVDASLEDLTRARRPLPHPQVSVTTAGDLRAAGFDVAMTAGPPHCTVYLGDETPDDATVTRLRKAFRAPVRNPLKKTDR